MERKISGELLKWKVDSHKRPMMLYGISGCGKTYSVLSFGKSEYKNIVYFDCNDNLELSYVFDKNSTLDKLVRGLSAISLETIFKDDTLIVFDNVSEKVFKSVVNLFSNSSYHVIMITDEFSMVDLCKGKNVVLKKMQLVSFFEYLKFIGKEQLIAFIEDSFKTNNPMPFHALAMECYNDYIICGGYPNAIVEYHLDSSYNLLSSIHENNIVLLKSKWFSLDNLIDIKRNNEIFSSISIQLLKSNRKFLYGLVRSGARSKDYSRCLDYLESNNMVIKSIRLNEMVSPISKCKDEESFKVYYNDTGILYKRMNVSGNRLLMNDKLMMILYENSIACSLVLNGFNVYHFHSDGKAYVDFVVQTRTGKIIPMELISSDNTKSKSLLLAIKKYNLSFAIRLTSGNFDMKNGIKYVPYYACCCINEGM